MDDIVSVHGPRASNQSEISYIRGVNFILVQGSHSNQMGQIDQKPKNKDNSTFSSLFKGPEMMLIY